MSQTTAIVLVVLILTVGFTAAVIVVVLAAIRGWVESRRITTSRGVQDSESTLSSHPMFDRRNP